MFHMKQLFCTNMHTHICAKFFCVTIDFTKNLCYNIITVKEMSKTDKLTNRQKRSVKMKVLKKCKTEKFYC